MLTVDALSTTTLTDYIIQTNKLSRIRYIYYIPTRITCVFVLFRTAI